MGSKNKTTKHSLQLSFPLLCSSYVDVSLNVITIIIIIIIIIIIMMLLLRFSWSSYPQSDQKC